MKATGDDATVEASNGTLAEMVWESETIRSSLEDVGIDPSSLRAYLEKDVDGTSTLEILFKEFSDSTNLGVVPKAGKYSKRRCEQMQSVIIVRVIFISSFLFYCLLFNHSFPTNPNKITNCFKTYSLLMTNFYQTTFAQCVRLFLIFRQIYLFVYIQRNNERWHRGFDLVPRRCQRRQKCVGYQCHVGNRAVASTKFIDLLSSNTNFSRR